MTPVTAAVTDASASVAPGRRTAGPGFALHVGLDASTGVAGHLLMVDLAQALMSVIAEIAPGATTHAALALGDHGPQRDLVARFGEELAAQVPGARRTRPTTTSPGLRPTTGAPRPAEERPRPAAELPRITSELPRVGPDEQRSDGGTAPRVVVDLDAHEVTVDGEPVPLANRELELLTYLLRAPHRAVPRSELLTTVWGRRVPADGTRTIDVHVRRLREKLGGCLRIVTVRGVGYRCDPTPEIVLVGSGDAG